MSGIKHELHVDDKAFRLMMTQLKARGGNLRPALRSIGEAMLRSTEDRFRNEKDPRGVPWAPLSDAYRKRKKGPKILTETGMLRNIAYQVQEDGVRWGTNRVYGAIHQLGGEIEQKARRQVLAFNRKGKFLSRKAAEKRKTAVDIRIADIKARTIQMPARPYLGVSSSDRSKIMDILTEHMRG